MEVVWIFVLESQIPSPPAKRSTIYPLENARIFYFISFFPERISKIVYIGVVYNNVVKGKYVNKINYFIEDCIGN